MEQQADKGTMNNVKLTTLKTFCQERYYPMLLFVAGVVMLVWNHWSILHDHLMFIYALFCGPPAFWGGLGSLIDPRILYPHYGLTTSSRRIFFGVVGISLVSIAFLFWLYGVYYGVR